MTLQNLFKKLGASSNTPTIAMCLIATFKGIFRPTFTMMDKKSDPETKKYAAIREGLTEVAALPLYAATPFLAGKLAVKIANKMGPKAVDIDQIKGNAKFLGLGLATLLIPAVCNVIQPPIMKAYQNRQDAKKAQLADSNAVNPVNSVNTPSKPAVTPAFNGRVNYGMKVGG